jgi:hypothetical protein
MFVNHPHLRGQGRGRHAPHPYVVSTLRGHVIKFASNHPHIRGRGCGRHAPHPYTVSTLRGHMSKFACNGMGKAIEASVSCNYVVLYMFVLKSRFINMFRSVFNMMFDLMFLVYVVDELRRVVVDVAAAT